MAILTVIQARGPQLIITDIADGLTRGVENVTDTLSETLFEPVIRLGVTGLSRAGKTVFITSLVANLMDRGRMPGLLAASEGRISAAFLQPQPDDTVPRFDYESHLAALTAPDPRWPDYRNGCYGGDSIKAIEAAIKDGSFTVEINDEEPKSQ